MAAYEATEHPHDGIERIGTILLMIANIRVSTNTNEPILVDFTYTLTENFKVQLISGRTLEKDLSVISFNPSSIPELYPRNMSSIASP